MGPAILPASTPTYTLLKLTLSKRRIPPRTFIPYVLLLLTVAPIAVSEILKTESVPPIALASLSQIVELLIVRLEFFAKIIPSKFWNKRVILSPFLIFTKFNVEVELLNLKFAHQVVVIYGIKLIGLS